jgi:arsenite-transporting ATPase
MFGGKGGVGKTTAAAATALHWAHSKRGGVLVISTDPAHSLSDSFEQPIGDQITAIQGEPNLFALAIDAGKRLKTFKERYGSVIETIMERGTYFDQEDIQQFLALTLPGMDELMAVIEIAELVREEQYALVILDTAPTGHTLRLLALPELLAQWLHVLDLMLEKHRYMRSVFGRPRRDETDDFMERMKSDTERLRALLQDTRATEFVPVTIPEAMSIEETSRLVETLESMHLAVRTVVINRVAAASECSFCARRHWEQQPSLQEIAVRFGQRAVRVPLLPHQVHGLTSLRRYADLLVQARSGETVEVLSEPALPDPAEQEESWLKQGFGQAKIVLEQSFILVGGKGGVGKTTVASATAIHLAREHEGRKVLLFSVDPAHSLSDCLGQHIGNKIVAVEGVAGLDALEMDATALLAELNQLYRAEMQEAFDAFGLGGNLDIAFDRQVMEELISLAPPGLDEIMALMKLMELVQEDRYAAYVLDLAPTGHALRLLETPGLIRQWFIVFFKLLVKYRNMVSLERVGELLRARSKQLRQVQQILTDAKRCQLIAVTIPEAMAVEETRRLLDSLARIPTRCSWVVANMIYPPSSCAFCTTVREEQQEYLQEIEVLGPALIRVPAFPYEPRGVGALSRMARLVYGDIHG